MTATSGVKVDVIVNDVCWFSDVVGCMNRIELQELMRLDDILRHCKQRVDVVDCSAKDGGVGLQNVMAWIQHSLKLSSPS